MCPKILVSQRYFTLLKIPLFPLILSFLFLCFQMKTTLLYYKSEYFKAIKRFLINIAFSVCNKKICKVHNNKISPVYRPTIKIDSIVKEYTIYFYVAYNVCSKFKWASIDQCVKVQFKRLHYKC